MTTTRTTILENRHLLGMPNGKERETPTNSPVNTLERDEAKEIVGVTQKLGRAAEWLIDYYAGRRKVPQKERGLIVSSASKVRQLLGDLRRQARSEANNLDFESGLIEVEDKRRRDEMRLERRREFHRLAEVEAYRAIAMPKYDPGDDMQVAVIPEDDSLYKLFDRLDGVLGESRVFLSEYRRMADIRNGEAEVEPEIRYLIRFALALTSEIEKPSYDPRSNSVHKDVRVSHGAVSFDAIVTPFWKKQISSIADFEEFLETGEPFEVIELKTMFRIVFRQEGRLQNATKEHREYLQIQLARFAKEMHDKKGFHFPMAVYFIYLVPEGRVRIPRIWCNSHFFQIWIDDLDRMLSAPLSVSVEQRTEAEHLREILENSRVESLKREGSSRKPSKPMPAKLAMSARQEGLRGIKKPKEMGIEFPKSTHATTERVHLPRSESQKARATLKFRLQQEEQEWFRWVLNHPVAWRERVNNPNGMFLGWPHEANIKIFPDQIGMRLDRLSDRVYRDILRIFDKVLKGEAEKWFYRGSAASVRAELQGTNCYQTRFESDVCGDAKLYIRRSFSKDPRGNQKDIVSFDVYPRGYVHPNNGPLKRKFSFEVAKYLIEKGLSVRIK